jgi:outer membrane protein assembly factor BamD
MKKIKVFIFISFLVWGFAGCSTKEVSNKSAIFWYQKIIHSVNNLELTQADNYFLSLKSEHRKSPLIKEAILILAMAHLDYEEYKVANYYYDTYIKLFGDKKSKEYISFLKIKSNFYSFKKAFRDQKLLIDTISSSKEFLNKFPNSIYSHEVKMIIARMDLAQISLNKKTAKLYAKIDKPKAQMFYLQKNKNKNLNQLDYKDAPTPWYRWIFE